MSIFGGGLRSSVLFVMSLLAGCGGKVENPATSALSFFGPLERADYPASHIDLLIVAAPMFRDQALTFRFHKESLGIRTQVLEWSGSRAADLKAKIEAVRQQSLPGLRWVLLLGDVDSIATYYDEELGDPEFGDYALNAGDIYYGQFPGEDTPYTPALEAQLSIGRIPAHSILEMQSVIDRIMNHEKHPPMDRSYYDRPTLVSLMQMQGSEGAGARDNYAEFMEFEITPRLAQSGYMPERIYQPDHGSMSPTSWSLHGSIVYPPRDAKEPSLFHMGGSVAEVDAAIQRGTSLLAFRGHGTIDSWGIPAFTYEPERFALYPGDRPPLILSISCLSGFFDSETIADRITHPRSLFQGLHPTSRSLSENFLLDAHGALGVLAATRRSAADYNNRLTRELFRQLIEARTSASRLHLGDWVNRAKVSARAMGETPEETASLDWDNRHHMLIYNLLGDPSLVVRTEIPSVDSRGQR